MVSPSTSSWRVETPRTDAGQVPICASEKGDPLAAQTRLFTLGKFLLGFYIGRSVSASAYGASGSLVIVVAWIYYSALLLYFGAEFTRVYANKLGSLALNPNPKVVQR